MFRFLGEVKSHRKKRKNGRLPKGKRSNCPPSDGLNESLGDHKEKIKSRRISHASRRTSQLKNLDQFFDSVSIETSLYTTPSKPTIKYSRRDAQSIRNIDWKSSESSENQGPATEFTAEFALAQYRLGGWQSPPMIKSSFTPSTESSVVSSSSLSTSHYDQGSAIDETDLGQVMCSNYAEVADNVSLNNAYFLHTVDQTTDEPLLESCSIESSEISWRYDTREIQARDISAKSSDDHFTRANTTTDDKEPEENHILSNDGGNGDEGSVCSSVSSLSSKYSCLNSRYSMISSWSPMSSPPSITHDNLTSEICSSFSDHRTDEMYVANENSLKSNKFLRINDSISNGHDSIPTDLNDNEQVSFSELISRCEGESLARRLASDTASPSRRHFGRTIETESSNKTYFDPTMDMAANHYPFSGRNNLNVVTPKISNTLTSFSDHYHMIIDDSSSDSNFEAKSKSIGNDSMVNSVPKNSMNFSNVLAKFEARSLEYKLEPPETRRLIGRTFQTIVDARGETVNSSEELCHANNKQENYMEIFPQDSRNIYHTPSLQSSCPCNEENSPRKPLVLPKICENEINMISLETKLGKKMLPPPDQHQKEKLFISDQVADAIGYKMEHLTILVDKQDHQSDRQDIHKKNIITANSYNAESSTTLSNFCQESTIGRIKAVDTMSPKKIESKISIFHQQSLAGTVDADKLLINGVQPEITMKHHNTVNTLNLNETLLFDGGIESDIPIYIQRKNDGPVDLDELSLNELQLKMDTKQTKFVHTMNEKSVVSLDDQCSYDGPVDLDQLLVNESSENPSEFQNKIASLTPTKVLQSKETIKQRHQDKLHSSIYCNNEVDNTSKTHSQNYHRYDRSLVVDKCITDHKRNEEVVPIDVHQENQMQYKYDSRASLSLCEDQLIRHTKSMERQNFLPNSMIPGFDDWRRKQENERFYFDDLQQKIVEQRKDQRKPWSKGANNLIEPSYDIVSTSIEGTTKFIIRDSVITTQKFPPKKRGTKALKFFFRIFHRNNGGSNGIEKQKQLKKKEEIEKWENAVAITDKLYLNDGGMCGSDDISDVSLFPLSQLEYLTKNAEDYGLRKRIWEQLELDYQKQKLAEIDKEKGEWREQIRISMLKEQELKRQRRLQKSDLVPRITTYWVDNKENELSKEQIFSSLPPCVVCNNAERTHVSLPCLHFCFCSECAKELYELETPTCPVCHKEDIILNRVYT